MTDMTSTTHQNEDGLQVLKAIMFNGYRIETLTHYLPQTRKWHPCRPPRCVCCAWMGGEGKGQITAARGLTDLRGGVGGGETGRRSCYLAPTNSSQGGSLLQRRTGSKGPKLSVRYSTLSEQLWSKSTLGATLVDLQDIVADSVYPDSPHSHSLPSHGPRPGRGVSDGAAGGPGEERSSTLTLHHDAVQWNGLKGLKLNTLDEDANASYVWLAHC